MTLAVADSWLSLKHLNSDTAADDIHPLVTNAFTMVQTYLAQSISHFALQVNVQPIDDEIPPDIELRRDLKMRIIFSNYFQRQTITCRPHFRRYTGQASNTVDARYKKHWIPLKKALAFYFPAGSSIITDQIMQDWWDKNGKFFNWKALPTELKDNILQFCVGAPHGSSSYWHALQDHKALHGHRKPRMYEIMDPLGEWRHLLHVSHQVRTLVLRLVLDRHNQFHGGLTIVSLTNRDLKDAIWRLGRIYQMRRANSVPTNPRTAALARKYQYFPTQYPHLSRFATMAHGIRKLYLQFDYLESLQFFKISAGSTGIYRTKSFMTFDVFERLPNLDGVRIVLPTGWSRPDDLDFGPHLFHETEPCLRPIHRLIYQRAAEVLATFPDVGLVGFVDDFEEQRFKSLQEAAALRLQFTPSEMRELYAECGGGVLIDTDCDSEINRASSSHSPYYMSTSSWTSQNRTSNSGRLFRLPQTPPESGTSASVDIIFPPRCECEIPCTAFLNGLSTS